jgi:uncharacterized lipoprotein YmbA
MGPTFDARSARFSTPRSARVDRRLLLAALVVATLPGCFSLGRDSPALEQYVLGAIPVVTAAESAPAGGGVTVGVRRLDLAHYLATPAIVVRRGAQQIVTSDFHRWGEDPAEGINRAFARYLAAEAGVRVVDVAPWPVRSEYDALIQLHVTRFEGVLPADLLATEGAAHVVASWEIIRQRDEAVLARGVTDYRQGGWEAGDFAALVTLLDGGLVRLARDVAAALGGVATATAPPE